MLVSLPNLPAKLYCVCSDSDDTCTECSEFWKQDGYSSMLRVLAEDGYLSRCEADEVDEQRIPRSPVQSHRVVG